MIYSVWDWGKKKYDYYQTSEGEIHSPPARMLSSASPIGATPEEAAVNLPSGAEKVGEGEEPKGQIATKESPWGIGTLVIVVAALWLLSR